MAGWPGFAGWLLAWPQRACFLGALEPCIPGTFPEWSPPDDARSGFLLGCVREDLPVSWG